MNQAWCNKTDGSIGYGKRVPHNALDFAETAGSLPRLRRVVEECAQRAGDGAWVVPGYAAADVERGLKNGR